MKKWDDRFLNEDKFKLGYYYWTTPDGQDCFKKMLCATKYGTAAGLVMSFYDIAMLSHPKGYFQGLSRVAYFTVPAASVGLAFSAMSCALTQIRNKDDPYNYMISGFCAGTIWGAARENVGVGARMGLLLALLAFFTKIGHEEHWDFFARPVMFGQGTYNLYKFDMTLSKDPKDKPQ